MPQISGNAKMQSGSVADKVQLLRLDNKTPEYSTVPTAGTGAYSITVPAITSYFVIATKSGERALAHGPVVAVDP